MEGNGADEDVELLLAGGEYDAIHCAYWSGASASRITISNSSNAEGKIYRK
jgi:hypothetical protein